MIFLIVILSGSTILFLIVNTLFMKKLYRPKFVSGLDSKKIINISIVIAAKNEQANILNLLKSIAKLNYPKDKFEIIIVDDQSQDSTSSIIQEFIISSKYPLNLKLISSKDKPFPAKKGALAVGIAEAKFEYILTTDADCVLPVDWLGIASSQFLNGSEIILGLTAYFEVKNFLNHFSSYEKFRGQLLAFLFAVLGLPYSANGGNFGFKKSAYKLIEGYKNIQQTYSGDDDLFVNEAVKNKLTVTPILNSDFTVRSSAPVSWSKYFNQRARHTSTSIYYPANIKILLFLWHISNFILMLSCLLISLNFTFIIPVILKFTTDIIISSFLMNKFGARFNKSGIVIHQILYEVFLLIHFINSFRKIKKWD